MEMKSTFGGFSKHMQTFFRGLRKHNDRDWFEAHREIYEQQVKGPMEELTVEVMAQMVTVPSPLLRPLMLRNPSVAGFSAAG